ncbi:hypothetical protein SAMN05444280_13041 [Tangfeifania diversioriginum]|jgi:uncharacterized membrane protein|uniref:Chloroplast import component protein (Tic20) n=1 Tax=Tangfeifania diversioriginum TaxID=1168035 RepID=A0A1M6M6D6_9BACT|nr:hypothetical protein [Tangfeifania diversioriginum]SHJ79026.1 hypothetical protein SAMN05444280_13041 [Tangfeifania diversioriginum]
MDGKTKAIVAHITIIGWIIALVINSNEKDEFASYYIRQTLGIYLAGLILTLIPVIGWIVSIVVFVFWILSLIGSIQGEKKETPWLGKYFQEWFKAL